MILSQRNRSTLYHPFCFSVLARELSTVLQLVYLNQEELEGRHGGGSPESRKRDSRPPSESQSHRTAKGRKSAESPSLKDIRSAEVRSTVRRALASLAPFV